MPNRLLSFCRSALLAGMSAVLAVLSLSARAQTPARTAFDILEVGRWSNSPKKANSLATHHTHHSAAMKCDVGYSIYLPSNYAAASLRYPVVYWLPGGGCNEEADSPPLPGACSAGLTKTLERQAPSPDICRR
jgi:S-formylglutathione hydrolase FrmB